MPGDEQLGRDRRRRPGLSLILLVLCHLFMWPPGAVAGEPTPLFPAEEDLRADGLYIPKGFPTGRVPVLPTRSEQGERPGAVVRSDRPGDGPLVKLPDGRVVDHAGNVVRVERLPWWDGISVLSIMMGYGAAVLGVAGIVSVRRHRRRLRSLSA